ncbi:hypothetical protein D7X96_35685 [Corallococcus interemptor]|uniref:Uncharacterized protein n=1 Tax=Corallococcus interemptor TaxID=2316720 RepID=A0A3A8PW29_9BACT|nr:hypothetical protein [Corallococcus interemptor]RKH59240.1 hypothetical protein D7X96_35685 [Corallococcus interemptor]
MSSALQTRPRSELASGRFGQTRYMIRRKFFKLFGGAFHIYDEAGNVAFYSRERGGALRRKALSSILRDTWLILDVDGNEVGKVEEDSMLLALVRRFLTNLLPQTFTGTLGGEQVLSFRQHFNPFIQKIDLDFSMDTQRRLDRRLGIAAAVLLCAIEGRQSGG